MLGTAAHQEGSTDTTQAAAANLLHQWRVCLVHLWVHTQDETGLSLPEKGIFNCQGVSQQHPITCSSHTYDLPTEGTLYISTPQSAVPKVTQIITQQCWLFKSWWLKMIRGCSYGLVQHQSFGNGQLQKTKCHLHPEESVTSSNGIADSKGRVCLCPHFWGTDSSFLVNEKHRVNFSVKIVAATTQETTLQGENPGRTDVCKGSEHLGRDQVENRLKLWWQMGLDWY